MFHEVNDMLARILTAAAECMKTTECNHYAMYTSTVQYIQKGTLAKAIHRHKIIL